MEQQSSSKTNSKKALLLMSESATRQSAYNHGLQLDLPDTLYGFDEPLPRSIQLLGTHWNQKFVSLERQSTEPQWKTVIKAYNSRAITPVNNSHIKLWEYLHQKRICIRSILNAHFVFSFRTLRLAIGMLLFTNCILYWTEMFFLTWGVVFNKGRFTRVGRIQLIGQAVAPAGTSNHQQLIGRK
ncbi:hypothetical protein Tco_0902421 [Tanacetum coccineum]